MREPDIELDGWCLDGGEAYHADAPSTFWIPARDHRESLQPGDFAKLIFRISVDNSEEPVAVERMWVVVRKRIPGGYLGVLDNEPDSIGENDEFWVGTELPFRPEHIINIEDRDAASISLATEEPRTRWPIG
jgi:hypothetical protein